MVEIRPRHDDPLLLHVHLRDAGVPGPLPPLPVRRLRLQDAATDKAQPLSLKAEDLRVTVADDRWLCVSVTTMIITSVTQTVASDVQARGLVI